MPLDCSDCVQRGAPSRAIWEDLLVEKQLSGNSLSYCQSTWEPRYTPYVSLYTQSISNTGLTVPQPPPLFPETLQAGTLQCEVCRMKIREKGRGRGENTTFG